jgi:magnesium transporter
LIQRCGGTTLDFIIVQLLCRSALQFFVEINVEVNRDDIPDIDQTATPLGNLMDTKTSYLDDVLNEKLENAFHKPTAQVLLHDVAKIASEHDPIDLAVAVTRLPPNARAVVYENLPDQAAKVIFMIHTGSSTRTAIFKQIDDYEL